MATVYHTYTVPYLSYNWTPVVQQQGAGFAGAAFAGAPGVAVGGVQVAGGAPGAGIFGGPIPTELEIALARTLLSRLLGTGGPIAGPIAGPTGPATCPEPCEAKLRALQAQIADLDRKIEGLKSDTRGATLLNTRAIVDLQKEVDLLCAAILKINPADSKEKIVESLQDSVKRLQEGRK